MLYLVALDNRNERGVGRIDNYTIIANNYDEAREKLDRTIDNYNIDKLVLLKETNEDVVISGTIKFARFSNNTNRVIDTELAYNGDPNSTLTAINYTSNQLDETSK